MFDASLGPLVTGVLLVTFGPIAVKILERLMGNAPTWVWRVLAFLCVAAGWAIVLLNDPIKTQVKLHPKTFMFLTALVLIAAGLLVRTRLFDATPTDSTKRDFLVARLHELIKETDEFERNDQSLFSDLHFHLGIGSRIEEFLGLYSTEWVTRFREKKILALNEIIKELLDGAPIPGYPQPVKAIENAKAEEYRRVSLEELEKEYEVKKLEPNFVDLGNEYVPAHNDDRGVIVRGSSPNGDSFHVLVRSFGNQHPGKKVRSVQGVSFRLNFICFDEPTKPGGANIHRSAWLTEAETDIDFPAHCPPRRAIVVTAEGQENRVYAIRRDSDSSYKGILPLREELTGSIYTVFLTLLVESQNSASFQYILEIIREPSFALRLTDAVLWKREHLRKFMAEGFAFSTKLHEIWKDAHDQVPSPTVSVETMLLTKWDSPERASYADYTARVRAVEQEQEGKLIEEIKRWEMRAADFEGLFIGAEARDKFMKSVPSIDDGFNRAPRRSFDLTRLTPSKGQEPSSAPKLPYWTLSDAVSSRTDTLMRTFEQL